MSPPKPPGYTDIVRANQAKAVGYLLAFGSICERIRDEELRRVRRNLKALAVDDLTSFRPSGSWMVAVLIGPGHDTRAVAKWVSSLRTRDRDRVLVYYLPRTDVGEAVHPWLEAGMGSPPVFEMRDFVSFHKVFGNHLNDRIWLDHS